MDNYSSMKLELLGLRWAVTIKFRDLLMGAKFTVFTDNNPLSYFRTSGKLAAMFDFEIRYRSGKSNGNADALSRKTDHGEGAVEWRHGTAEEVLVLISPPQALSTPVPMEVRHEMLELLDPIWLQEVHTRASGTEPTATATLPQIPVPELVKFQQADPEVARLVAYHKAGHRPTRRQLAREPKGLRKLLGCCSPADPTWVPSGTYVGRLA